MAHGSGGHTSPGRSSDTMVGILNRPMEPVAADSSPRTPIYRRPHCACRLVLTSCSPIWVRSADAVFAEVGLRSHRTLSLSARLTARDSPSGCRGDACPTTCNPRGGGELGRDGRRCREPAHEPSDHLSCTPRRDACANSPSGGAQDRYGRRHGKRLEGIVVGYLFPYGPSGILCPTLCLV